MNTIKYGVVFQIWIQWIDLINNYCVVFMNIMNGLGESN